MWQVATAKNKFSELITKALTEGPQHVRRRGETVVVMSEIEYERLRNGDDLTIADFLLNGPSLEGLEFDRDPSPGREVDLE
jgi:antitoxin Phd